MVEFDRDGIGYIRCLCPACGEALCASFVTFIPAVTRVTEMQFHGVYDPTHTGGSDGGREGASGQREMFGLDRGVEDPTDEQWFYDVTGGDA